MSDPQIYWEGQSGKKYGYWIHPIGTSFKDAPGNYIYAKETQPGRWKPLYIGQTSSLKDRLGDHEKESCAKRNGATHIHAHTSSDSEATRKAEESDLISKWKPVCNEQLT
jgi:predicted GIY-YIG superfamily endonuclease